LVTSALDSTASILMRGWLALLSSKEERECAGAFFLVTRHSSLATRFAPNADHRDDCGASSSIPSAHPGVSF
jgi:hypothetical protein